MKRMSFILILIGLLSIISTKNSFAKNVARTAGIGIRGSYWKMKETNNSFKVYTNPGMTEVDIGSGGGYLYFLTRMNERWLAELSIGAMGRVETRVKTFDREKVDVSATAPILLGFRNEIFPFRNTPQIQPYLSFGAGPYWMSDIHVEDEYFGYEEEVTVRSKVKPGGYLGGGVNFMMSSWFGLNFDLKYHFIKFDVNHPNSGYEYGLGMVFMWGKYEEE